MASSKAFPDSEQLADIRPLKNFSENEFETFISCSETFSEAFTSFEQSDSGIKDLETSAINCASYGANDAKIDKYSCSMTADSGILESESIMDEELELVEFIRTEQSIFENSGVMNFDFTDEEATSAKDEFHDAVSFFSDPISLSILENAGSTISSNSLLARSSLYQKFDPLYTKFFSDINSNEPQKSLEDNLESYKDKLEKVSGIDYLQNEVPTNKLPDGINSDLIKMASNSFQNVGTSESSNINDLIFDFTDQPPYNESTRKSLGNLLSLEFTMNNTDYHLENRKEKIYTEEEFQLAVKVKELLMIATFLRKERDLEAAFLKKQHDLESKLVNQICLSKSLCAILREAVDILKFFYKQNVCEEKLEIADS